MSSLSSNESYATEICNVSWCQTSHKEKEYPSSDDSEDDSGNEEENTWDIEITEEVHDEGNRNEKDSSKETENQIHVENNDGQEQHTSVSKVKNVENDQENDLIHQDIQRLKRCNFTTKI